jgi:hypothetical protein
MPNWRKVSALPPFEQIPIYRAHLARKPKDAAIWFDLGLSFKRLRDWASCADANRSALRIESKAGDPAWWNLGIATTALRDWSGARAAWRGYGIDDIPDGDGPIACDYGSTPVRLPHGEVVWGDRIDPARVIIRNVPLPDTEYRWGDVVLHDGQPNGERVRNGRKRAVFDVLERWSPSEIPTLRVETTFASHEDGEALVDLFDTNHFAAEDWTTNVRYLCTSCSEGSPHDHAFPSAAEGETHTFGLACPRGLALTLLAEWRAAAPEARRYEDPEPV